MDIQHISPESLSETQIKKVHKKLALICHSDTSGITGNAMTSLNNAKDKASGKQIGQRGRYEPKSIKDFIFYIDVYNIYIGLEVIPEVEDVSKSDLNKELNEATLKTLESGNLEYLRNYEKEKKGVNTIIYSTIAGFKGATDDILGGGEKRETREEKLIKKGNEALNQGIHMKIAAISEIGSYFGTYGLIVGLGASLKIESQYIYRVLGLTDDRVKNFYPAIYQFFELLNHNKFDQEKGLNYVIKILLVCLDKDKDHLPNLLAIDQDIRRDITDTGDQETSRREEQKTARLKRLLDIGNNGLKSDSQAMKLQTISGLSGELRINEAFSFGNGGIVLKLKKPLIGYLGLSEREFLVTFPNISSFFAGFDRGLLTENSDLDKVIKILICCLDKENALKELATLEIKI